MINWKTILDSLILQAQIVSLGILRLRDADKKYNKSYIY